MRKLLALAIVGLGLMAPNAQACEDTTPPIAPQVRGLIAVSGTQAWVEWTDSTYLDRGDCQSGGVTTGATVYQNGGFVAGTSPVLDMHGIRNGSDHEALTSAWLSAGQTYTVRAWAMDSAENVSEGNAVGFTTPNDYRVVVAGQAKQANSTGVIPNLLVRGQKVIGGNSEATFTNARGLYALRLPANASNEDWDITYGPGCGGFLPAFYCASSAYAATDSVTVGSVQYPPGRILPKSKAL